MPDLITQPGVSGYSDKVNVRNREGRFNWNVPPKFDKGIGGGKSPMYLFEDEKGESWFLRLEKDKQGGRWEDNRAAEAEYLEWVENPKLIKEHWGDSDVSDALMHSVKQGMDFRQMKELVKGLNTWRQISGD